MYIVQATTALKVKHRTLVEAKNRNLFKGTRTLLKIATMQLQSLALVFTVVVMSLLSTAAKASPVLLKSDDKTSMGELKAITEEQEHKFKRICGMSLICQPYGKKGKKREAWIPPQYRRKDFGFPSYRRQNYQEY